jgi:hypothetical protein
MDILNSLTVVIITQNIFVETPCPPYIYIHIFICQSYLNKGVRRRNKSAKMPKCRKRIQIGLKPGHAMSLEILSLIYLFSTQEGPGLHLANRQEGM